jgi:signal peptidase I
MEPTISYGDNVFTYSLYYDHHEPERGDIGMFEPYEEFTLGPWTHRIIAIPGDRVVIQDEYITVNGEEPYNPYIFEAKDMDIIVPEGRLFQKGDNEETMYGLVDRELLIGKVIFHFSLFP